MKVKPVPVVVLRGFGFSFDDPGKSPRGETTMPDAIDATCHEEVPAVDPDDDTGEEVKEMAERGWKSGDENGARSTAEDDSDSGVAH